MYEIGRLVKESLVSVMDIMLDTIVYYTRLKKNWDVCAIFEKFASFFLSLSYPIPF